MKRSVIVVAAVAAALFLASGTTVATDLLCSNISSSGGTWRNVLVPAGTSCHLQQTRVTGSITVQAHANLLIDTLSGDTTVNGDIKGDGCDSIDLESTGGTGRIVVGGNLTIQNCTGASGFSGARGNSSCPPIPPQTVLIGGNVKCSNNGDGCVFDYVIMSGTLDCSGNSQGCTLQSDAVGKSATINNNVDVGIIVNNSAIGGDLKCTGNSPGATGSTNTVAGTKSGQCSGL
jgi:hypothetical protein